MGNIKRKKPAPQSSPYKQLLMNTPTLCKSQIYSEIYNKLKSEGRLGRFIAVVQYCSIQGYDIDKAVEFIRKSFPGYISEEFDKEAFELMLKAHTDISDAWGFGELGDEVTHIQIKNIALRILEKSGTMEDIKEYFEIFGKQDTNSNDNRTIINFNLEKKTN